MMPSRVIKKYTKSLFFINLKQNIPAGCTIAIHLCLLKMCDLKKHFVSISFSVGVLMSFIRLNYI